LNLGINGDYARFHIEAPMFDRHIIRPGLAMANSRDSKRGPSWQLRRDRGLPSAAFRLPRNLGLRRPRFPPTDEAPTAERL
jgi:hypothetical protein